jgi:hypothetical protein
MFTALKRRAWILCVSDRSDLGCYSGNVREYPWNGLAKWIGLSALVAYTGSIPGALPQAGIDRAFGPPEIVQIAILIRTKSAEGANHIGLGQSPRKLSESKRI